MEPNLIIEFTAPKHASLLPKCASPAVKTSLPQLISANVWLPNQHEKLQPTSPPHRQPIIGTFLKPLLILSLCWFSLHDDWSMLMPVMQMPAWHEQNTKRDLRGDPRGGWKPNLRIFTLTDNYKTCCSSSSFVCCTSLILTKHTAGRTSSLEKKRKESMSGTMTIWLPARFYFIWSFV